MSRRRTPTWFKALAIVALVWNFFGLIAFVMDLMITDEAIQAMDAAQRDLYTRYPVWTKVVYAFATVFGFMGALGLVLRKRWALRILVVSMIAVIIQMGHSLIIAKAYEVLGATGLVMPSLVVLISILLVYMAQYGMKRYWLK